MLLTERANRLSFSLGNLLLHLIRWSYKIYAMITGRFSYPTGIYLFKMNKKSSNVRLKTPQIANQLNGFYMIGAFTERCFQTNIRATYKIRSTLTIKTPDRRHQRCSGFFIASLEQISHLVSLLLKQLWTDKCLLVRFLKITLIGVQNSFDMILFLQGTSPNNNANKQNIEIQTIF